MTYFIKQDGSVLEDGFDWPGVMMTIANDHRGLSGIWVHVIPPHAVNPPNTFVQISETQKVALLGLVNKT